MRVVQLKIGCGELTCAESPGVFCRYFRQRVDGSQPTCALFNVWLKDSDGGVRGWLLRCKECLRADISEEEEAS